MPLFDDDDETTQLTPQEHQRRVEQWGMAQKKFDALSTMRTPTTDSTANHQQLSVEGARNQQGMYDILAYKMVVQRTMVAGFG